MIVSRRGGELVLVRQVDHQEQCAAMAVAWGNDRFARPAPYEPLVLAAGSHDEGWREWERRPQVAGGVPVDFPDVARTVHVEMYARGIAAVCARDPAAGLLVSMHGSGLYDRRIGVAGGPSPVRDRPPPVREFVERQHALQARLQGDLTARIPQVRTWSAAAARLLQVWDLLSLFLVWRALPEGRTVQLPRVPRRVGDDVGVDISLVPIGDRQFALDPYPFAADAAELPVVARTIPDRVYRDAADLGRALAEAEVEVHRYMARPEA